MQQPPPIVPPLGEEPQADPRVQEEIAIDPDVDPDLIDSAEADRIAAGAKPSDEDTLTGTPAGTLTGNPGTDEQPPLAGLPHGRR